VAHYKYSKDLSQLNGREFDDIHRPGATSPYSGIYRCEGCGWSITALASQPLPGADHHQHTYQQGEIRWRLVVRSHFA
jgi:hypothetical protein